MSQIVKGGLYQHYKGMNYIVHEIVKHSETLEDFVYYECLYDNEVGKLWVRPLSMFVEKVIVDGESVSRFKYIGNQKGKNRL